MIIRVQLVNPRATEKRKRRNMDGKEKGLERTYGGHHRPQHVLFLLPSCSGWVPNISYSLSGISSTDNIICISKYKTPVVPKHCKTYNITSWDYPSIYLPSTHLMSIYHQSLSAINMSIYASLIYHLSLSAIHPSIYLSLLC